MPVDSLAIVVIDPRSIITSPTFPQRVAPGWVELRGIAWSGRGSIARAEVSFDEGRTWHEADLQPPVLPEAHRRFRYLWKWDGRETTVLSRAIDDTGYVQPTQRELLDARGPGGGTAQLISVRAGIVGVSNPRQRVVSTLRLRFGVRFLLCPRGIFSQRCSVRRFA